ncbi:TSC22 domain family protein 1-like isoform X1 [Salarias fasciatus]|uniref:TSC22 domain family protein 1 n=1 Tax=Salarias fasciatus TaxID=181472 RepID=A0A672JAE9_SALFA|nr:TSC22 domain family protein 1-like isoform X1 [Salarias fasciatus]XP_029941845.1 TSC22 domain family protein 1-like isoform X1 [Salarias fasciatus]
MHHQDFSGDAPGSGGRKPAYHFRRGSSSAEDHQGPASPSPGTASPGGTSHHHHQQQPPPQAAGAQVKKKSGFQITSVTSAQTNASGNNSLADDTESYDDMDESHTEDLSSSEMLDMPSRAADATGAGGSGVPERSSSDETLNSLHGVDSPGLGSPNEPPPPQASLVNGTAPQQHYYPQRRHDDPAPPTMAPKPAATSAALDNTKPAVGGGTTADPHVHGVNIPAAAPLGSDNANMTAPSRDAPAAANTHSQHTQTATGSRFRVVKLDTNSEPFRKGRWTCTEYYEKEVPHPAAPDALRGGEAAAEGEASNAGIGIPAAQPYQPPAPQDFAAPLAYASPPELVHKPVPLPAVIPQQLSYVVDPSQAAAVVGAYPAAQLRQPDFIQPTAPFQTQVQPPPPHVAPGLPGLAGLPPTQPAFGVAPQPQHHVAPVPLAPAAVPYMPLTALQADLQPLLAPGAGFTRAAAVRTSSQLEDAQKLLLQHQGLLGLPRLGGDEAAAHMGMSAEASAFMAAAAGLRSQHGDGDDDSSSGASVVAIDNKIEQAMDLVKSHLMYAVREEVEVLKEQIKELVERNSQLEQENNLLKTLASPEQMAQFQAQVQTGTGTGTGTGSPTGTTGTGTVQPGSTQVQSSGPTA